MRIRYGTRTGALLRVDGAVAGAFDAQHRTCSVTPQPGSREVTLEVEKRSLPVAGLPSRGGLLWRLMLARARQRPTTTLTVDGVPAEPANAAVRVVAVGHAHLDVAWLWRYAQTRRKALRTFATAIRQVEAGRYVFAQSQPQLYAWVEADDPALFARVRARAGRGWDAGVAAMWVEPDMHAPSGESILRQLAYGMRYTREKLGVDARVVWLPDSFGFPSTLPSLAAHAGATGFVTTKLQWNESTRWPYPQFVWRGDDGARLTAAVLDRYDGGVDDGRVRRARERREPLVVGFGDGGGGATDEAIAAVAPEGWTPVETWLASLDAAALPSYSGELYLETHRGTYTTHRDVKSRNAALERALDAAEEACAWCVAVRAAPAVVTPLLTDLRTAWTIVLRNQFHDVLAGSSIGAVYADVHAEYDRADRIVERVHASASSLLPRAGLRMQAARPLAPHPDGEAFTFDNEFVHARVRRDGIVIELAAAGGPNIATLANALAAYVDKPARWDAWNLDATYLRRAVRVRPRGARVEDDGLLVRFTIGKRSSAEMRIELRAAEPYLRVEVAVDWREDRTFLRVEHRLAVPAREVRYGQPHGSLVRSVYPSTPAERAKYEVPAQRWALVDDGARGCAVLAPDTYGWSAAGLRDGGVRLGMSLLRSPRWPDPAADRGERRIAYALAPTAGALPSALEAAWNVYAGVERVRLFSSDDAGVLIVAAKPADDGAGVIVRVRECDGVARDVALRCGGRMRRACAVDACERVVEGDVTIAEETLRFALPPFALRSFRVEF
ncbi:MAG: alpha-mannosidase [Candidatus Velthaea sp.]